MCTSLRHYLQSFLIGIILYESFLTLAVAQRVAPGVPPSQYVSTYFCHFELMIRHVDVDTNNIALIIDLSVAT